MGFIADLSRYDPVEAVDQYDGVILNVEDPGFAAKRDRAIAKGKPWGAYSWVYPGQGRQSAERSMAVAGSPPLGHWLDYEEAGVSPSDLQQGLARGDELGMKIGAYTYSNILPTVAGVLGDHPLWLAYYPGANDGNYNASYSNDARAHGAVLHQFTSTNGTRDLNVVLDGGRWSAWTGSTSGGDELTPDEKAELGQWMKDQANRVIETLIGDQPFGAKAVLAGWENDTRAIVLAALKADNAGLADAIVAKLPKGDGGGASKADVEDALRKVLHSV